MGQQRPGLGRQRTRRLGSAGFVPVFYGSADPRIAPGYVADPGTVLIVAGQFYWKFSTGNTDWILTPWLGSGVVTSINGLTGAVTLTSPMLTELGQDIRLDNGNSKNLPGGFVTADIDTDVNTAFVIPKLTGNVTVPVPKTPTGNVEDRKITFYITGRGTPGDVVTWTTGVNGFVWATQLGPLLADFNSLLAATPNNAVVKLGMNYSGVLREWMVTALAGYFT